MRISMRNEFKIGNIFFPLKDRIEVVKTSNVVWLPTPSDVYETNFTTNKMESGTTEMIALYHSIPKIKPYNELQGNEDFEKGEKLRLKNIHANFPHIEKYEKHNELQSGHK